MNFILALSILLMIFTEFPNAVIDWDTINFARLVLLASDDFRMQLTDSLNSAAGQGLGAFGVPGQRLI
jgi:hypothetical protein